MANFQRPIIAVLIGNTETEYAKELFQGFTACAKEENVNLVFLTRSTIPHIRSSSVHYLLDASYMHHLSSISDYTHILKPDALIIAYGSMGLFPNSPTKEEYLRAFKDIPTLILEDNTGDSNVPSLVANNYAGMMECMTHLIEDHGYQKIAFVAGPACNFDSNERLRAYRDAMHNHNLSVTDSMVVYSDYSDHDEPSIDHLLDAIPDLEAIAFANDNMARGAYKVCARRGIRIGKDLAITGFDDVDIAKTMNPPLTSIAHGSFLFSYSALQDALELCRGQKPSISTIPTIFQKRCSCGCNLNTSWHDFKHLTPDTIQQLLDSAIEQIVDTLFFTIPYKEEKERYHSLLKQYFANIFTCVFENDAKQFSFSEQFPILKELCSFRQISAPYMLEQTISLLGRLHPFTWSEPMRRALDCYIAETQHYIYSEQIQLLQTNYQHRNELTWFSTAFTRDLLSANFSYSINLASILERLAGVGVQNSYIFLHKDLQQHNGGVTIEPIDKLYLAAFCTNGTATSYEYDDWIPFSCKEGMSSFFDTNAVHSYFSYMLFSGTERYGLMLCETPVEDNEFIFSCSLQIGSLFHTQRLQREEEQAKIQLQESLQLIREQNSILNFISESDELTGLLNRRGFMEQTLHTIADHYGASAYLLFADIDHLKEINDVFGHEAGDFAIKTAADYLRTSLPQNSLIGRIGGDEFVALILCEHTAGDLSPDQKLHKQIHSFNENSDIPYYIELSAGIYNFTCNPETELAELLRRSDFFLYEEKKKRRKSIKKIRNSN